MMLPPKPHIGTLQESSLHAALKAWYAQPGDESEVLLDGFVIDLRRGATVIEIQTRNFAAMKRKLAQLVEHYPVRLIHPIAQEKWIVRSPANAETILSRRKSPRRGQLISLFTELVSFPQLAAHPNFTLEVVLTQEEEWQRPVQPGVGRRSRSWRRKGWAIYDRRLLGVLEQVILTSPADYRRFLPDSLPALFTNSDLATAAHQPLYLTQKVTYCLRQMGVLEIVGQRGRARLFAPVT
jgi:hypothetical protein